MKVNCEMFMYYYYKSHDSKCDLNNLFYIAILPSPLYLMAWDRVIKIWQLDICTVVCTLFNISFENNCTCCHDSILIFEIIYLFILLKVRYFL